MDDDGHAALIGGLKDPLELLHVLGLIELDVRVAEMQLDAPVKLWVSRTAAQFF